MKSNGVLISRQEQIDAILDSFDFEQVHKVMTAINWTWSEDGVPDIYELRKTVRQLLKDIQNQDLKRISTGGFTVDKNPNNILELSFNICQVAGEDLFGEKTKYE